MNLIFWYITFLSLIKKKKIYFFSFTFLSLHNNFILNQKSQSLFRFRFFCFCYKFE